MDPDIVSHYAMGVEEDRLSTWGRLERERTLDLLGRFLPPAPATVLDVGGGPGVYAVHLARAGYDVHLIDPVGLHVEQARAASAAQPDAPLGSAELGDARALAAGDRSVDAVLLLGPLYHLVDAKDRRRALREARRVLRPGGVLAAAAISRFGATIDGLATEAFRDPGFEAIVEADQRRGHHRNPDVTDRPEWFTTAYFHLPGRARGRGPRRRLRARGARRGRGRRPLPGRSGPLAGGPRAAGSPHARDRARGVRALLARREPTPARGRPRLSPARA